MSQVTIGIDVSKAQFDIFVSNGQNHSCKPNTPCGIKALIKTLSKLPDCLVVFEATGFYPVNRPGFIGGSNSLRKTHVEQKIHPPL